MIATLLLRPFGLADLGWQLRLGEMILTQGTPWVADRFAATHLGEPIVPNAWLAQVVFAAVRDSFGWTGLRALDALLWFSGLLVAMLPALRRSGRPLALLLALLVGFVVALPAAGIRPQSFAAPLFALTLVLAQVRLSTRWTLILALPLFVLWQNLHPSVAIAVAVLGASSLCLWWHDRQSGDRAYFRVAALTALAALASVLTPAGLRIYEFSAYNAEASLLIGATEWLPLWSPENRAFLGSVLVSGVFATLVAWRRRRELSTVDWVAPAVCFILTLGAARFILFYAIAVVPLVARIRLGGPCKFVERKRTMVAGVPLSLALVALALAQMPLRIEPEAPVGAVKRLTGAAPPGTVFCDPAFGGTLIDQGNGRWTVSFDGRFYAYSRDEIALLNGTADPDINLASIEQRYRPVAFLLARLRSPGLIARLQRDGSGWRVIYADQTAVAFVRATPAP